MEPGVKINIKGAVYYNCDAHQYPNKLMKDMIAWLKENGLVIKTNEEVNNFILEGNKIKGVRTNSSEYFAEHIILATGAWSREVAARLKLRIPMVGGRGYSVLWKIHHTK